MKKIIVLGLMVMLMAMGTGCGSINAAPEDDMWNSNSYGEWETSYDSCEDDADVTNEYNYETNNYSYEENYSYEYNDDYDYEENYSCDVTYECEDEYDDYYCDYDYDCEEDYSCDYDYDDYEKCYDFSGLTDEQISDSISVLGMITDYDTDEMIEKTEAELDYECDGEGFYHFWTESFFGHYGEVKVETCGDDVEDATWVFYFDGLTDETMEECEVFFDRFIEVCEAELPIYDSYEEETTGCADYTCYFDNAELGISMVYYEDGIEVYVDYAAF